MEYYYRQEVVTAVEVSLEDQGVVRRSLLLCLSNPVEITRGDGVTQAHTWDQLAKRARK